jgi:NAD(P)H-hydrate repair Nnr-like enzyme with NAD(P)H-hydrate dehydratase domain
MALAYEEQRPTVLDAGGLAVADRYHPYTLLTPHAGELSELLSARGLIVPASRISDSPLEWAQRAAEALGATVLLKGARTCVASANKLIELPLATPWLSTAGTGDVLAGIIGAMTATHSEAIMDHPEYLPDLAASGAYIHATAAERASQGGPLTAEAVIKHLPEAIRGLIAR